MKKIRETKSTHITLILSTKHFPPVFLNNKIILLDTSVKYLGLHLDQRLTRATQIKENH